jgi:hypothetical protein
MLGERLNKKIFSPQGRGDLPHPPAPSPQVEGENRLHLFSAPLRLCGLILLILSLPFLATSQTADDILSKFFAVQQDDEVLIRWTITAGNTCEDTYIERSLDGISFERIGLISGVCGSPDQPITYDFYDTVPIPNRLNIYRLELGLYGYTLPQSAEFIVLNKFGYSLQPNPMGEKTTIIFQNPQEEQIRFFLYDMNGKTVMDFTTTRDRITLYRNELGSGVFVFALDGQDVYLQGKLVVP